MPLVDINENDIFKIDKKILENLLYDKTLKKNIVWATDDYMSLGQGYNKKDMITIEKICGSNEGVICPRSLKTKGNQWNRKKTKAEVFTPSWICNAQNNLVDESWFGEKDIFNVTTAKSWITKKEKITFADDGKHKWTDYVDCKRLEITCGEAPYLTSRYDMNTGKYIDISERIGMLDRKFRVIHENVSSINEWYSWAIRALESIYGFEYQGDNLIIARENILLDFFETTEFFYHIKPDKKMMLKVSNIIAWNIWQMDGISYMTPYSDTYSKVHDWRSKETLLFSTIIRKDAM